jgi:hypothetical protein
LRQFSIRYAIRALRNLPEKELRYLRTVIVTADIDEGFGHRACTALRSQVVSYELSAVHTHTVNLLASVKRHPLYISLRFSRELCFC